jgi:hypothetical protein
MEALAAAYEGPHRVRLNRNSSNLHIGAHIQKAAELANGELIVVNAGDNVSEPHRVERIVGLGWPQAPGLTFFTATHAAFRLMEN